MTSPSLKRRSSLWMLMAMLCLLFLTPFTQLSSTSNVRHTEPAVVQKDTLTAEIEEDVLLDLSEFHHFLNLRMEKLGEKPAIHPKEEGIRTLPLFGALFLGEYKYPFHTLYVPKLCTCISSSIRFFTEYIRLLN